MPAHEGWLPYLWNRRPIDEAIENGRPISPGVAVAMLAYIHHLESSIHSVCAEGLGLKVNLEDLERAVDRQEERINSTYDSILRRRERIRQIRDEIAEARRTGGSRAP